MISSIFKPIIGAEWVVGVVGVLQFEVMADRIKNEFGLPVMFEPTQYYTARWVACDDKAEWKKFEDKIRALPLSTGAKIQRFFFSNTDEASCDKQGRVLVSDFLKKYAKLDKDIVISGVGNRLEIWDAETYDQDIEGGSDDADIIAAQMEILGI